MDASQLAVDAMYYVSDLGGLLLIIGAIAFADLTIWFLVKLVKQARNAKW